MPRYRSRFSDLERQFRESGGVAAPGSRLAKYIDYKSGKTKIERRKTTKLTAVQRRRYGISLLPFNLDAPAAPTQADRYITSITRFSLDGAKSLGLTDAMTGHGKQVVGDVSAKASDAYYPAIIRPSVRTGGANATPTTPKSSITGREYSYYESSSYGIPFGRRTPADSEEERRFVLAAEAKGTANDTVSAASVGYEPEVFRGDRQGLPEAPV